MALSTIHFYKRADLKNMCSSLLVKAVQEQLIFSEITKTTEISRNHVSELVCE